MTTSSEKKSTRALLLRGAGSVIAFGVVVYLVWQNWQDFLDALQRISPDVLLGVLFLAFASRLMVTVRWFILLRVAEPNVTFWQVFRLSFVGLFTTNVLPSTIGGDVVKLGGAVQLGLDSAAVTASLVVDRLVGMGTMVTFLPFGVSRISEATARALPMMAASGSGTFFSQFWHRLSGFMGRTWKSLKLWLQNPWQLVLAAFFSLIHMACTFTMVTGILSSLGDPISWWTAGGLWVLVYFITLMPLSINGLGLQEASLSLMFTSFAGVAESNSLVLALLIRVLFMIASLPGAFFLPRLMAANRDKQRLDEKD